MRRLVALGLIAIVSVAACSDDDAAAPISTGASTTGTAAPLAPSTAPDGPSTPSGTVPAPTAAPAPTNVATPTAATTVPLAVEVACAEDGGPTRPALSGATPLPIPEDATAATPDDSIEDVVRGATDAPDPVVVLHAGTYPVITIRDGGPLTIVGESRDEVAVAGFVLDGARDVTIRGLTISGNEDPSSNAVTITGRSTGIHLSDVTIDPLHNAGVAIIDGSSDVTVEHSLITGEHVTRKLGPARNVLIGEGSTDTSRWVAGIRITDNELVAAGADGIQVAGGRDVEIRRNFVHDLQENDDHNDGIQVVAVDGAVIESNTFTSLSSTSQDQSILLGHLGGGAGPRANPVMLVRDVLVANNLVHHWAGAGITVSGTIDVTIANNTSVDNRHEGEPFPGLLIDSRYFPNENLKVINNIVSDIQLVGGEAATQQAGNVVEAAGAGPDDRTGDPCFADRSSYGLTPQSPAVDFGVPDGAPAEDIDGRVRSGTPDAGAVELS